jgi:hypothetical protein
MSVELFTATSRVTGEITTHHIHMRDELNDPRLSILILNHMEVALLSDLRASRLTSSEGWLQKGDVLLAVPYKVKGTTSILAQRSISSRLGKNEHRILVELHPFRIVGNLYLAGKFSVRNALRRDQVSFSTLSNAEVTFLPDPSISFVIGEVVFNTRQVKMLCAGFETA